MAILLALVASRIEPRRPALQTTTGNKSSLVRYTLENNRVITSPQTLWKEAQKKAGLSFSFHAFLLASMAVSEYASGSEKLKTAVMFAALNYAKKYKTTLEKMLIPDGKLGGQAGRYASTARPPSLPDVLLAVKVEKGLISDPTGGAVQFDSPRTQLIQWQKGDPKHKHPNQIAADRQKSGKVAFYLPGEDPGNARFWRPVA